MSWLYSQALVEEYLGDICLDGEQSVQSNGNPTQQAYLSQDKMTGFSRLSQYGMTYKPLTEDLGEELLMSFRAGFHAKTFQLQEKEQALQENDQVCGNTWQGSLAKYDLNTFSWKTAQCSLFEDLELSLEIFPRWGSMQNGELFQREISVLPILENESGLLQQMWATPTCMESLPPMISKSYKESQTGRRKISSNLRDQVHQITQMWPTPDANCGARGTQEIWTPKRKSGHQAQYSINQAVRDAEKLKFPTPQASDHGDRGNMSNPSIQRRAEKGKQLNLSMVAHPTSGQLNPTWVEWLMGWPIGWTDLKPLEMDKYHSVQPPLGNYLHKETNDSTLD